MSKMDAHSTQHLCFLSCNTQIKPSTPIEIPSRKKSMTSPYSPITRPTSPEQLIFDMSPISPYFPKVSCYSPEFASSPKTNDKETFMYHFPVLPARYRNFVRRARPSPAACHPTFPSPVDASRAVINPHHIRLQSPRAGRPQFSSRRSYTSSTEVIKAVPRHRITGFVPSHPDCVPSPSSFPRRASCLPPPTRSRSFSSSPWILPGKCDAQEDDTDIAESLPSALEFDKYLMHCIENEKSTFRLRRTQAV